MPTIRPSRTSIATYLDPRGVTYTLTRNQTSSGPDDEATVTEYQAGRSRVVATGPVDVLRARLTTWADDGGGNLR